MTLGGHPKRFAADHPERHEKSPKPKDAEPPALTFCQLRGWQDLRQVGGNVPLLINRISLTPCFSRCSWRRRGRTWEIGDGESLGEAEDRGQEAGGASSSGNLAIKQRGEWRGEGDSSGWGACVVLAHWRCLGFSQGAPEVTRCSQECFSGADQTHTGT